MKHTKGPWKVIYQTKNFEVFSEAELVSICETSSDDDQSKINAQLIAAAPEMLEALELILEDNRLMNAMNKTQVSLILAAVRKAKGE